MRMANLLNGDDAVTIVTVMTVTGSATDCSKGFMYINLN